MNVRLISARAIHNSRRSKLILRDKSRCAFSRVNYSSSLNAIMVRGSSMNSGERAHADRAKAPDSVTRNTIIVTVSYTSCVLHDDWHYTELRLSHYVIVHYLLLRGL